MILSTMSKGNFSFLELNPHLYHTCEMPYKDFIPIFQKDLYLRYKISLDGKIFDSLTRKISTPITDTVHMISTETGNLMEANIPKLIMRTFYRFDDEYNLSGKGKITIRDKFVEFNGSLLTEHSIFQYSKKFQKYISNFGAVADPRNLQLFRVSTNHNQPVFRVNDRFLPMCDAIAKTFGNEDSEKYFDFAESSWLATNSTIYSGKPLAESEYVILYANLLSNRSEIFQLNMHSVIIHPDTSIEINHRRIKPLCIKRLGSVLYDIVYRIDGKLYSISDLLFYRRYRVFPKDVKIKVRAIYDNEKIVDLCGVIEKVHHTQYGDIIIGSVLYRKHLNYPHIFISKAGSVFNIATSVLLPIVNRNDMTFGVYINDRYHSVHKLQKGI